MAQPLRIPRSRTHPPPEAIFGQPVVVVGMGPAGIRVAQEIIDRDRLCRVVLYEREPWAPYHRVRLSSLMLGTVRIDDIANELRLPADATRVVQHRRCTVTAIDRAAHSVSDSSGRVQSYSHLILATGSSPHIPHIRGIALRGVYTFRSLSDAQQLMARTVRSLATVVLGGGPLGLEVARGMQRGNTAVTVIEHLPRLMPRQLDAAASRILAEQLGNLGIELLLGNGVAEVVGRERVEGVRLHNGREIACDTIVLTTGIRPNIELARQARLAVNHGILVDDRLLTSDPCISAIGECAEHRRKVYGLVGPGLDQAAVVAHIVAGGRASYRGSLAATMLQVAGRQVFSIGCAGEDEEAHRDLTPQVHRGGYGIYRKLVLRRSRLVGALALGEWSELARVQEAVTHHRRLWPWQLRRFRSSGNLWSTAGGCGVTDWPAATTICNCTGVTRGRLRAAIDTGCPDAEALAQATGASTICGSCRPLLAELCRNRRREPKTGWRMPGGRPGVAALLILVLALVTLLWTLKQAPGAGPTAETRNTRALAHHP